MREQPETFVSKTTTFDSIGIFYSYFEEVVYILKLILIFFSQVRNDTWESKPHTAVLFS